MRPEIQEEMRRRIAEAMRGRSVRPVFSRLLLEAVAIANAFWPALKDAAPSLTPEQADPLFEIYNRLTHWIIALSREGAERREDGQAIGADKNTTSVEDAPDARGMFSIVVCLFPLLQDDDHILTLAGREMKLRCRVVWSAIHRAEVQPDGEQELIFRTGVEFLKPSQGTR